MIVSCVRITPTLALPLEGARREGRPFVRIEVPFGLSGVSFIRIFQSPVKFALRFPKNALVPSARSCVCAMPPKVRASNSRPSADPSLAPIDQHLRMLVTRDWQRRPFGGKAGGLV